MHNKKKLVCFLRGGKRYLQHCDGNNFSKNFHTIFIYCQYAFCVARFPSCNKTITINHNLCNVQISCVRRTNTKKLLNLGDFSDYLIFRFYAVYTRWMRNKLDYFCSFLLYDFEFFFHFLIKLKFRL